MTEVRNLHEGALRWVAASGSGTTWATASAPTTGLLGFVTNFTFTSAQTMDPISNRGTLSHWKRTDDQPVTLSWDLLWGITANYPTWITSSGASVPMIHLEFESTAPEAGIALWHQFHGVVLDQLSLTEANPSNTQSWTCRALGMNGPTASGYLA